MRGVVPVTLCLCLAAGLLPSAAPADVSIGVHITLPPLVFSTEPELVVVPSGPSYVYMVPGREGLYFFGGYWYRTYRGGWYRARIYDGPWSYVEVSRVPRYVLDVPPDYYRRLPPGYHRVPYGEVHRHWREWDRDRHWHKYDRDRRGPKEREVRRREYQGPSERGKGGYGRGEPRYERGQARPDRRNAGHDHRASGHERGGKTHQGAGGKPPGPASGHPHGKPAYRGTRELDG
jgi:hypothetical protein